MIESYAFMLNQNISDERAEELLKNTIEMRRRRVARDHELLLARMKLAADLLEMEQEPSRLYRLVQ